jgi:signal recognition particle subunit SRP54
LQQAAGQIDERQFTRVEAIIGSMTAYERRNHEVISGSRRKRIAAGSGTTVQDVNQLLRQYAQMAKMFKQMGKGGLAKQMMRGGMSGLMGKQKFGR